MNGAIIPQTPIAVDFWQPMYRPTAKFFFLTHLHSDHTKGLSSSWSYPLYCSPVSQKLLIHKFKIRPELIIPLAVNTSHLIRLDNTGQETMTVTVIDANHCPGAVMYLFEGYFGSILYTGDFRYRAGLFVDTPLVNIIMSKKTVDVLYLDNTYCSPACIFPVCSESQQRIIDIITQHPDHKVVIALRNLGKEDLLINIAYHFKTWIVISKAQMEKMQILQLSNVFTTDNTRGYIRVESFNDVSLRKVRNWNKSCKTIVILPTALYTVIKRPYRLQSNIHIVAYSNHSSYPELTAFVRLVIPKKIIPIVRSSACRASGITFNNHAEMSCFNEYLSPLPMKNIQIPQSVQEVMKMVPIISRIQRKRLARNPFIHVKHRKTMGVVFDNGDDDDHDDDDNTMSKKSVVIDTSEAPPPTSNGEALSLYSNSDDNEQGSTKDVLSAESQQLGGSDLTFPNKNVHSSKTNGNCVQHWSFQILDNEIKPVIVIAPDQGDSEVVAVQQENIEKLSNHCNTVDHGFTRGDCKCTESTKISAISTSLSKAEIFTARSASHSTVPSIASNSHTTVPSMASSSHTTVPSATCNSHNTVPSISANSHTTVPSMASSSHTTVPSATCNSHSTVPSISSNSHTTIASNSHSTVPSAASNNHTTVPSIASNSHTIIPSIASTSHTTVPCVASNSHTTVPSMASNSHTTVPSTTANSHTTVPFMVFNSQTTVPSITSNSHTTVPSIAPNSHTTVPSIAPNSHTTVPSIASNSHTTVPSIVSNSHTTVPSITSNSHTTVPSIAPNSHTTVPSIASNSHTTVPSIVSNSHTTVPSIASNGHTTVPSISPNSHTTVPSIASNSHTTVPSIVSNSHTTVPSIASNGHTTVPSIASNGHTTAAVSSGDSQAKVLPVHQGDVASSSANSVPRAAVNQMVLALRSIYNVYRSAVSMPPPTASDDQAMAGMPPTTCDCQAMVVMPPTTSDDDAMVALPPPTSDDQAMVVTPPTTSDDQAMVVMPPTTPDDDAMVALPATISYDQALITMPSKPDCNQNMVSMAPQTFDNNTLIVEPMAGETNSPSGACTGSATSDDKSTNSTDHQESTDHTTAKHLSMGQVVVRPKLEGESELHKCCNCAILSPLIDDQSNDMMQYKKKPIASLKQQRQVNGEKSTASSVSPNLPETESCAETMTTTCSILALKCENLETVSVIPEVAGGETACSVACQAPVPRQHPQFSSGDCKDSAFRLKRRFFSITPIGRNSPTVRPQTGQRSRSVKPRLRSCNVMPTSNKAAPWYSDPDLKPIAKLIIAESKHKIKFMGKSEKQQIN